VAFAWCLPERDFGVTPLHFAHGECLVSRGKRRAAPRARFGSDGVGADTTFLICSGSQEPHALMKKCPFCAEEIQEEAIRCRYCQSDLTATAVSSQNVEPKKACPRCGTANRLAAPVCWSCGHEFGPNEPLFGNTGWSSPARSAPQKKVSCFTAGCLVLLVLFLIAVIAGEFGKTVPTGSSASNETPSPTPVPSPSDTAVRNVELVKFSWSTGGFDNIMMATFAVRNNNDFAVKDITIKCTHSANSGTIIDSNERTIYERIEPRKIRTFRDFNMGFINSQAARSRCEVTGVVPAG